MGREEQIEEREVLDSIFPDEITGEAGPRGVDFFSPPPLLTALLFHLLLAVSRLSHSKTALFALTFSIHNTRHFRELLPCLHHARHPARRWRRG